MAKNTADAKWTGNLEEGDGKFSLGNGACDGAFSAKSRFGDGEEGTNPEELIAAAHAACFSMAFSHTMHGEGIESESVETHAQVTIKMIDGAPTIALINLNATVTAPGADEDKIRELGEQAKADCPVSRALAAVNEVVLEVTVS